MNKTKAPARLVKRTRAIILVVKKLNLANCSPQAGQRIDFEQPHIGSIEFPSLIIPQGKFSFFTSENFTPVAAVVKRKFNFDNLPPSNDRQSLQQMNREHFNIVIRHGHFRRKLPLKKRLFFKRHIILEQNGSNKKNQKILARNLQRIVTHKVNSYVKGYKKHKKIIPYFYSIFKYFYRIRL